MDEVRRSSGGVPVRGTCTSEAATAEDDGDDWCGDGECANCSGDCVWLGVAVCCGGGAWCIIDMLSPGDDWPCCCWAWECATEGGGAIDCIVMEVGEMGGEAMSWLGECNSGDEISIGGLTEAMVSCAGAGGGRGTAVILANSVWKEVVGEYMLAMLGNRCGGAL